MKAINYRREACGRECQIRIPGVCNRDTETTVLCHVPYQGIALKSPDLMGAWGCSSCHDAVDRRLRTIYHADQLRLFFLEGVIRTQDQLIRENKL